MNYTWNWNIISTYKYVFLKGIFVTIELTLIVIILGTILGIILALLKKSDNIIFSLISKIYIEIFRALPILILLIWIFYVFPIFGLKLSSFWTAVLALSLNLSAYVAESVRSGIESIHKIQLNSALTLGFTKLQAMLHIILPQALKQITPNLLSLYITQLKMSSLASVIAVNELLHQSNTLISATFRPLEIYTTVGLCYLILILPFILIVNKLENNLSKKTQQI